MSLATIILFFVYTWGLGFSLSKLFKPVSNFWERNIMRLAFGLALVPIIGVILNLFGLPVDWKIFLVLAILGPLIGLFKNIGKINSDIFKLKLTKSNIYFMIVLVLFFLTFFMYVKGAFVYPYMEDDDAWGHAASTKYISVEKTLIEPIADLDLYHYMDSYPPGYNIIMAILHQTSPSLSWTLKFFNALIISLGILFIYFFVLRFTGSRGKAIFASFALTAIPSYLSHFIWAHGLIVTLFLPAFYCLEMIRTDKNWLYGAAVIIAGIFLIQPTQSVKFVFLFLIYFIVKWVLNKKFDFRVASSLIIGGIISLFWWIPTIVRKGSLGEAISSMGFRQLSEGTTPATAGIGSIISKVFHSMGTASREYSFSDFFIAKGQNMINNPVGVGWVLTILLILGVVWLIINLRKSKGIENQWRWVLLFWLFFAFIGVNGCTKWWAPYCLFSFRFWMLFALFSSMVIPEGYEMLKKMLGKKKVIHLVLLVLIIFGVFFTSFSQKYEVNTSVWGFGGGFRAYEEIQGYIWIKANLPVNSYVFPLNEWNRADNVFGVDMYSCTYCEDEIQLRKDIFEGNVTIDPPSLHEFLKKRGYEYMYVDSGLIIHYGDSIQGELNRIVESNLFLPIHNTPSFVAFKLA